jgi:hypothetical protein
MCTNHHQLPGQYLWPFAIDRRRSFFRLAFCSAHFVFRAFLLLFALAIPNALAQDESATPTAPSSPVETSEPAEGNVPAEAAEPAQPPVTTTFAPAPASGYPGMTPAAPRGGTSQLAAGGPGFGSPLLLGPSLIQLGPVSFHPHLDYQVSYGNSLQPLPGVRVNSFINRVSPGMLLLLGSGRLTLDYTPSLRFYSDSHFRDGVDHLVSLSGAASARDWLFGFRQSYSATSEPLIETGSQVGQEIYSTSLSASHQLSGKISLSLSVAQNFRFLTEQSSFQPLTDSREWSTMEWVDYQINRKLSVGVGAGFTYDQLEVGPDNTSEHLQGRVNWHATSKFVFAISGGIESRQFLSSGVPNSLNPIYAASMGYQVFRYTSLSFSANRTVSPSYFQNSISAGTTLSAGLHQRLLKRISLDVSGQYGNSTYHSTTVGGSQISDYDFTSFNISLSTTVLKRANVGIFFQETFVSSTSNGLGSGLYNYSTTQGGLTLGYRF